MSLPPVPESPPPSHPPLPASSYQGPPVAPPGWGSGPAAPATDPFRSGGRAGELWPQPPQSPQPKRREGLLLAGFAVLAALLVVGGVLAFSALRGGDETVEVGGSPTSGPPLADPTETTPPASETPATDLDPDASDSSGAAPPEGDHVACPAEVSGEICDAARFVESFRGRPFKTFPTVQLVDDEAFGDRLLRDFDEDLPDIEITTQIWRSLGFIEPDDDLAEILATSWEIGTVGAYFTDTKELYVQGDELDLYAQMVVVHELTHAHDDQWLDLDRPEYDEATDEIGYGFAAVVEGNAQRVESAWRAELSGAQQEELAGLEAGVLSPEDIEIYTSLPEMLLFLQISPYLDGRELVDHIAGAGGEEAVDAALESPPSTSEQVLHPELFGSEEAIEVPVPSTDGAEMLEQGMVGELAFSLWLGDLAGAGWGGDQYVSWRTGDTACTRIDVTGDTTRDADELMKAADAWAGQAADRTVERVAESGLDLVRITGCY